MPAAVPPRLLRAADLLALQGSERVLEVGSGSGVLAELLLARHPGLRYVALDRSAVAAGRTARRNAAAAADGRLAVRTGEVEDAAGLLDADGPFDVVVAVNVNLFWTRDARAVSGALSGLLRPGGRLWLVYETPRGSSDGRVLDPLLASLAVSRLVGPEGGPPVVVRDEVLAVGLRRRTGDDDAPV
ncbi:class I SAM-dependent methyltransferase [Cellulosimicrobium sp. Marseille-Q8652]